MGDRVASTQAEHAGLSRVLSLVARDIKLAHTVFALPFALLAVFLAGLAQQPTADIAITLALVLVCMVLARTWAMLVNRLADREFDAANPRTARRVVASGELPVRDALRVTLGCAALFVLAAAGFGVALGNWWPALLALPVLAWIAAYSFTKRFTALCHIFLGGALAASPLAAAIAVDPSTLASVSALWWIAGMVMCWVAGFDVIYALQDLDFDRSAGLRSIPAALGWRGSAWVSRGLHVVAMGSLALAWRAEPRFGVIFGSAVIVVGLTLVAEHAVLAARREKGLDMAFFTLNGVIACVLGSSGIVDVLV